MNLRSREARIYALIGVSILASLINVVDSGEWYGSLYGDLNVLGLTITGAFRGVLFSSILEVFLAVMMVVRTESKSERAMNVVLWIVSAVIVGVIGFASFEGVVEANYNRLTKDPNIQRQIDDADKNLKQLDDQMAFYQSTGQQSNYARVSKERAAEVKKKDKLNDKSEEVSTGGNLKIGFLLTAKGVLLAANWVTFWLIGWMYRSPQKEVTEEPKEEVEEEEESPPDPLPQQPLTSVGEMLKAELDDSSLGFDTPLPPPSLSEVPKQEEYRPRLKRPTSG